MRHTEICRSWVVYRMTLPKQAIGGNVVCEQTEWDAIELARPGDLVLIAGKGHEKYQVIGTDVRPFDDVAIARTALAHRSSNSGVV